MARLRALLLFPQLRQIHLSKDVGCVMHYLHKAGFQTSILSLRNDKYDLEGFNPSVRFVAKPFLPNALMHLWKHAREIDVLVLFHTHPLNPLYIKVYKLRNPRGIAYVKADMDNTILAMYNTPTLKNIARRIKLFSVLHSADVFSLEQKKVLEMIRNRYESQQDKLIYVPNAYGEYIIRKTPHVRFADKENIIVTVGAIGSEQKATDIILKTIECVKQDLKGWKVVMAGTVFESAKQEVEEFFKRNPDLEGTVAIKGLVRDRREMVDLFRRAKIMFMPSRWETFSLALCEAAYYGDVIVATPVGGAHELTNNGRFGAVCPFDDVENLAAELRRRIRNPRLLSAESAKTQQFCRENYTWDIVIRNLDERLREEIAARKQAMPSSRRG